MSNGRCEVPIQDLNTLFGMMAGQQVTVLKDDGCNTNVVSPSFVNRNLHFLKMKESSAEINHSNRKKLNMRQRWS